MEKKVKNKPTEREWDFKVLEVKRVARVTAGGKRFRIRAVVIVGNYKGKVGVGIEKGLDISQAVEKAKNKAIKNAFEVPMVGAKTIPYEVEGKKGAGRVLLKPAKEGTSIVAGGAIRSLLLLAGYQNVSTKILGVTKNPLINVLAAFEALKKLSKTYKSKMAIRQKLLDLLSQNVDKIKSSDISEENIDDSDSSN